MKKRIVFCLLIGLALAICFQITAIPSGDAAPKKEWCCYVAYYEPGVPTIVCFPALPDGSCPDLPPLH